MSGLCHGLVGLPLSALNAFSINAMHQKTIGYINIYKVNPFLRQTFVLTNLLIKELSLFTLGGRRHICLPTSRGGDVCTVLMIMPYMFRSICNSLGDTPIRLKRTAKGMILCFRWPFENHLCGWHGHHKNIKRLLLLFIIIISSLHPSLVMFS